MNLSERELATVLAALEGLLVCPALNEDGNADEPETMRAIAEARAALPGEGA